MSSEYVARSSGTPAAVSNRQIRSAGASGEDDYTLADFTREYPDGAACLDRLWRARFAPDGHHAYCTRCGRERKFHRTKTRPSYTCDSCGLHVHPTSGTIFEKSTTPLELWFYAIYLAASTRCGISAKQLERELGVGYKTAHRMLRRIRGSLLPDPGQQQLRAGLRTVQPPTRARRRQDPNRPAPTAASAPLEPFPESA